jgi:Na+-driven multidrug efflux pump
MQPLAGLAFVLDGLVLGAGGYRTMQYAMIGALVAFVPLAAATLADHRIGLVGVWLALLCWLAARVVILGRHWARGRWAPAAPAPAPRVAGAGLPQV